MRNNEKNTTIQFHCNLTVESSLRLGESISGVLSTGIFGFKKKMLLGKDEGKTHSKFQREQTNVSCFKIGKPIWGVNLSKFLKN